jgi:hypothetical protein
MIPKMTQNKVNNKGSIHFTDTLHVGVIYTNNNSWSGYKSNVMNRLWAKCDLQAVLEWYNLKDLVNVSDPPKRHTFKAMTPLPLASACDNEIQNLGTSTNRQREKKKR